MFSRLSFPQFTILIIVMLCWLSGACVPALRCNLANLDILMALQSMSAFSGFNSSDWKTCETKVSLHHSIKDSQNFPLGAVVRLDCPGALHWLSEVGSKKCLSDVDVFWIGYALFQDGQRQAAINLWREHPSIASYLRNLAGQQSSDLEVIDELTGLAVAIKPDDWELWRSRGWLLQKERPKEADQAFEQIIKLTPNNYEGYLWLGRLRMDQGHYSEAIALCKRSAEFEIDNMRNHIRVWDCVGRSAFYNKAWDEAIQAFEAELALVPDEPEVLFWLGRTYRYADRDEAAYFHLRHAIEVLRLQPGKECVEAFAWYELGWILETRGELRNAAEAFRQVLALCSDFSYAEKARVKLEELESKLTE